MDKAGRVRGKKGEREEKGKRERRGAALARLSSQNFIICTSNYAYHKTL